MRSGNEHTIHAAETSQLADSRAMPSLQKANQRPADMRMPAKGEEMSKHYTKNTVEVSFYCPTCNKMTPHYVMDKRLGRCKNDHPHPEKPKKPEAKQERLFS